MLFTLGLSLQMLARGFFREFPVFVVCGRQCWVRGQQGGFPAWLDGHSSVFVPKCVPCSGHSLMLSWKMHPLCIYEICFSLLTLEIFLCFLRSGEHGLVFPQQVLPVLCTGCCGLHLAVTSRTPWSPTGDAVGARRAWHTPAALPLPAPAPLARRQHLFFPTSVTKQY